MTFFAAIWNRVSQSCKCSFLHKYWSFYFKNFYKSLQILHHIFLHKIITFESKHLRIIGNLMSPHPHHHTQTHPPPTLTPELPLPEMSRKAPHVLGHPAVIHRNQLGLLHHFLQVSWLCPPAIQVRAAFAGSPVGLNTGIWCVLKEETIEVEVGETICVLLLISATCWVAQFHFSDVLCSTTGNVINLYSSGLNLYISAFVFKNRVSIVC